MRSLFLLTLSLLFTGSLAFAEGKPLTITELVDIALKNHPSTRQAWWQAEREAASLGRTKSAYFPHIDLNTNVSHGRDVKFINGPDVTYTNVGAYLIVSMMLYDFGERSAETNAAKMALLRANWQSDWNIQKVLIKVLENGYSTLHSQEMLQAALASLEDAENVLTSTEDLNRAGLSPISDVYMARATYSQMKMELSKQKALLDIEKGKLVSSLGLSATEPIELAPLERIEAPHLEQTDELIDLALKGRADLFEKEAKASQAYFHLKKDDAAFFPKISFEGKGGADYYFHKKEHGAQYNVSLKMDVPLFDGFENMYKRRMAYADMKLSMEELRELEIEISLEVLTHTKNLTAAKERILEADEYLKNSIKAYESVLEKYKAGKERILEVSNAQKELADARVQYSQVKTDWLLSSAKLAFATGTLIPYMEPTCGEN